MVAHLGRTRLMVALGAPCVFLGVGIASSACVREGAPVVAPLDIEVSDAGAATALVITTPSSPENRCTARLRAQPIKTGEGCTLDERISTTSGTLSYPCSGDGPMEAIFGEHHFVGQARAGNVVLSLTTELEWEDHCQWETHQSLRGSWRRDARDARDARPPKAAPQLAWKYNEGPVSGTGCFSACEATAVIEILDAEH